MLEPEEQIVSLPIGVGEQLENDGLLFESLQQQTNEWAGHDDEGKLTVDVAETPEELIITAPMAGTPPQNFELHLHNDLLTIRGERYSPVPVDAHFFHHECYWGKFSRTVVLPVDVKAELAQAEYHHGVLTIRLPKALATNSNIPIMVVEE